MMLDWFNAREATELGTALADRFAHQSSSGEPSGGKLNPTGDLESLLRRASAELAGLRLNFYKKAKFANSFKWRLLEKGIDKKTADEVTQQLILGAFQASIPIAKSDSDGVSDSEAVGRLISRANAYLANQEYGEAVALYTKIEERVPLQAELLNNLGVSLFSLGRLQEAEQRYREAIEIKPEFPAALCNLADVLQANPQEAEEFVRRALRINPKFPGGRTKLGLLLLSAGREQEAAAALRKALKVSPKDADALVGLAQIERSLGRFEDAETLVKRALKIAPKMATAWAALHGVRKMTAADSEWLATSERIAGSGISLWEESELRFAIGKYYDDVGDFDRAFQNYRRGNELLRSVAAKYNRQAHSSFADDMIRTYSREALANLGAGGSASNKPIFVVGMPRSGTSLIEQIIASHPAASGAGEPDFWLQSARKHHNEMRLQILGELPRKALAEDYLSILNRRFQDAARVVDKTPANSDFVGLIYSALPNARFISMRRNPIDTCLSCYFQHFSTAMSYTMDLTDLAEYYRVHRRLMDHWVRALPSGAILEVPYEEVVANQEAWTRRILDFLDLEWDARCLSFHETKRSVNTASAWQVRQKIYRHSVERWRNYEKFIGPLKELRD